MDGYQNQNMNQQNQAQNGGYQNPNMGQQMPPQTPPRNWDAPVPPMSFGQQAPPGGMPNWLQYVINAYLSQQQRQPNPQQFSGFGQNNQGQPQPQPMPQQQVQQETDLSRRVSMMEDNVARLSEAIMGYLSRQNAMTQPPVEIAKRTAQNKSTKKEG